MKEGIPIIDAVVEDLKSVGEKLGVKFISRSKSYVSMIRCGSKTLDSLYKFLILITHQ